VGRGGHRHRRGLSFLIAPTFALASGVAFLVSEAADLTVYTPLERRSWLGAVVLVEHGRPADRLVAVPDDRLRVAGVLLGPGRRQGVDDRPHHRRKAA
jgi:hypothetical protein